MAADWATVVGSLGGVLLGAAIPWVREALREKENRQKGALYLSVMVSAHLDRLAYRCQIVAFDDGMEEGRPAGENGEFLAPTTRPPTFDPLEFDVEWKTLPAETMRRILEIPHKLEQLERKLDIIWANEDPWDRGEYFWTRRHQYASLGLEISDMNRALQDISSPDRDPEQNEIQRNVSLRSVIRQVSEERAAYAVIVQTDHDERQRRAAANG
jgi:hypothetical protein